jgi:chromosome segregation ATPase
MNTVIKPWLTAGLFITIAANVLLSAGLIADLSRFRESIRQVDEAESRAAQRRSDVSKLQAEVDSLAKKRDALAPEVASCQERMEEKAKAQAFLAGLEAKKQQLQADIDQETKRFEEAGKAIIAARQQETELTNTIEQLKTERSSLTRSVTEARELEKTAVAAERRTADAKTAMDSADARRKQLEAENVGMQKSYAELEKDTSGLRQKKKDLSDELAQLRKQLQVENDQLSALDQKAAEFSALQVQSAQQKQKLATSQQELATTEARAIELESRRHQAESELARLENRIEQARTESAAWETKRDLSQQQGTTAAQNLASAQKALSETQASHDLLVREQLKLASSLTSLRSDFELARKNSVEEETRLARLKAEGQESDSELAAARKLTQEYAAKQDELTRDVSRTQAIIDGLKQEKEALEKEIGKEEAAKEKKQSGGQ